ncbi:ubiquitin-protein ligase (E3) [Recurvomyces mirabilis]|uniref:HECT-type E3 ubiquitin transferase n=1 Tax=Recurvomyces mirabilis TaxID=574656 RepID=A0AAE0WQX6_9PEZI|nr:ubiquitin-protein ligase (E3) [Recurvomyces mirabilis]KAK5153615.1 ubiquitin-protein ligase (E3) [Recurvomyces mirabilis]
MYQTFSGQSRRPRQVNLSGRQITNPFASSAAGGPQSAIASAQKDRLHRQQQRERLQASHRIQKTWRGHSSRRRTFRAWRQVWDDLEGRHAPGNGAYQSEEDSLRQLRRLMLFFQPREDAERLTEYGLRQVATASQASTPCVDGAWPKSYLRLTKACVAALRTRNRNDERQDWALLNTLSFSVRKTGGVLSADDAVRYYEVLTRLKDVPVEPLQAALLAPLQYSEAYTGLAVLLASPLDPAMLSLLRSSIDPSTLCDALASRSDIKTTRSRLWLLGNLIYLAGVARSGSTTYITAVAHLLGSLADDVEFDSPPVDLDNIAFDREVLAKVGSGLPLNSFLHGQISGLINQESIRNLLSRDATSGANAQVLAGYALTLLRCFPRRADDIRMWLYLGPTRTTTDVGATQYFWNASRSTSVFSTVRQNSRHVVSLLQTSTKSATHQTDDWTVILVFLELYTFLLKIMDDEEFMGQSGSRSSAISLQNVGELVTFLKNLGFTLYFNASDLSGTGPATARDTGSLSLGRHFGHGTSQKPDIDLSEAKPLTLAGLPGLTIDYLKGLTTGLLRAIYERDSRRHFLPKDHWLMTDRFDMTAFIPGVVAEEESRHLIQDPDDDLDGEDPYDELDFSDDDRTSPAFTARRMHALRSQAQRERQLRQASRRRYMESVAPRLEILQNMPFFIPFTTRVEIFRQFVHLDQEKRRNGYVDPDLWRQSMMFQPPSANGMPPRDMLSRHHAKIRRKNEFSDAFEQFYELGADLKEPIQITFVDEFDIPEAGIDGGGVTKEFLTSVITQAFDTSQSSWFAETEGHFLQPSATTVEDMKIALRAAGVKDGQVGMRAHVKELLQQYEFLGRIIGKCLYEGILVDVLFAGYFLKKWALTGGPNNAPMESGYRANINDLKELDPVLYRGLLALKNAPAEQVEDFALTFTVDDLVGPENATEVLTRDLIPNGANTPVTAENRLIYINRISYWRLQGQSAQQTNAFLRGLASIVQPSWLNMFNQSELQTLIGGSTTQIDVADLRRNTLYGGVYSIGDDGLEHPSIQLFWSVMAALPDEERRNVLKFVTSTPRGPLLGFGHLNPRFSIRDSGQDEGRFPTTSTCVNLLKLPMYSSERRLREKLLAAVNSGAGFDLS